MVLLGITGLGLLVSPGVLLGVSALLGVDGLGRLVAARVLRGYPGCWCPCWGYPG
ncbi:hypothetical protein ACFQX6_30550 [Streptosporangium lutulentum]